MKIRLSSSRVFAGVAIAALGALGLSACSSSDAAQESDAPDADLSVAAALYPLEFVVDRVAGDRAAVLPLTAPGVEPHDLELSPAVVRELQNQDLAVYLADFQPAVDAAIDTTGVPAFDVGESIDLRASHEGETEEEHAAHEGESEAGHDEHDHGDSDPHFWLDPSLMATFATALGEEFAELDESNAAEYTVNAEELAAELTDLDERFTTGLESCKMSDIFVTHEAFGYLADRYGLHQEGLSGIDPEAEPSPARVREIRDLMAESGATTIFTESLVSANVAEALASDAGLDTEVLDPIEGVIDDDDYMSVMNRNLETLQSALGCS